MARLRDPILRRSNWGDYLTCWACGKLVGLHQRVRLLEDGWPAHLACAREVERREAYRLRVLAALTEVISRPA